LRPDGPCAWGHGRMRLWGGELLAGLRRAWIAGCRGGWPVLACRLAAPGMPDARSAALVRSFLLASGRMLAWRHAAIRPWLPARWRLPGQEIYVRWHPLRQAVQLTASFNVSGLMESNEIIQYFRCV